MDWFGIWFRAGFGLVLSGHWTAAAIQTRQLVKQRVNKQSSNERSSEVAETAAGSSIRLFTKAKRIR